MTPVKREYWGAIVAFLLIPVVVIGGMGLTSAINPEWAMKTAHYSRNFHLLQGLQRLLMLGTLAATGLLWLAVFAFLLKGKGRSLGWVALAALGPFGLAGVAMLNDAAPEAEDAYQRWRAGRGVPLRVLSEIVFAYCAWTLAYRLVVLKSDVQVLMESRVTGVPIAQILAVRNASSGMWAFSEGLEQLFLIAMIYLAWPFCFNLAARLVRINLQPK